VDSSQARRLTAAAMTVFSVKDFMLNPFHEEQVSFLAFLMFLSVSDGQGLLKR
jgi:hypothetical protein